MRREKRLLCLKNESTCRDDSISLPNNVVNVDVGEGNPPGKENSAPNFTPIRQPSFHSDAPVMMSASSLPEQTNSCASLQTQSSSLLNSSPGSLSADDRLCTHKTVSEHDSIPDSSERELQQSPICNDDEDTIMLAVLERVEHERALLVASSSLYGCSRTPCVPQATPAQPCHPHQLHGSSRPVSSAPSPPQGAGAAAATPATATAGSMRASNDSGSGATAACAEGLDAVQAGATGAREYRPPPYAQDLTAAQRRAALHDVAAPLLVLAGAPPPTRGPPDSRAAAAAG